MQVLFVAVQQVGCISLNATVCHKLVIACWCTHGDTAWTLSDWQNGYMQDSYKSKPTPEARSAYPIFRNISTRWADNDVYGHVNNVVYYSWFDTAVNGYLIEQGALDIHHGTTIGLVVETQCNYFAPVAFPQAVQAGVRVARLGSSSVRYEVGIFLQNEALTAAKGHFIHVYVDKATRRPVTLPLALKTVLEALICHTSP
jgi:acyl-CoA thioester hydrolase